jgi:hypothetical protein
VTTRRGSDWRQGAPEPRTIVERTIDSGSTQSQPVSGLPAPEHPLSVGRGFSHFSIDSLLTTLHHVRRICPCARPIFEIDHVWLEQKIRRYEHAGGPPTTTAASFRSPGAWDISAGGATNLTTRLPERRVGAHSEGDRWLATPAEDYVLHPQNAAAGSVLTFTSQIRSRGGEQQVTARLFPAQSSGPAVSCRTGMRSDSESTCAAG